MGANETLAATTADLTRLAKAASPAMRAFQELHRTSMADGALSAAVKECLALALGVAAGCEGCIHLHAQAALKAGATREQVAEALMVAALMAGGPGLTRAAGALHVFDELAAGAGIP